MRIVILSDVHSNLAALEAVLRDAQAQGPVDGVWCLGDTVGYGPQPNECVSRLRECGALIVAGNHDRAATGAMGVEDFNADAAAAALWTRERLDEAACAHLDSLAEVAYAGGAGDTALKDGAAEADFTLVHGTLRWPLWEYLYSFEAAAAHLERQETPFGLAGHTHVPMLVVEGAEFEHGCEMYRLDDDATVELDRARRVVINPGSVGQPRDGDPRSAYAVYDRELSTVTQRRVEYDFAATQKLMEATGLPRWLIDRLAIGR